MFRFEREGDLAGDKMHSTKLRESRRREVALHVSLDASRERFSPHFTQNRPANRQRRLLSLPFFWHQQ
jgi:hypothetical protein